jgi:5-methylcytosine-specific restriction endonuclease McrA
MTIDELCPLRAESVRGLSRAECEARRVCWWCGEPLTGRQRSWCSNHCWRNTYWLNHDWGSARAEAMRRAGGKCQRCGGSASEVNHREPLVGRGYHGGCVHHQENLEPLCHDCHVAETTRQLRERHPRAPIDPGLTLWGESA